MKQQQNGVKKWSVFLKTHFLIFNNQAFIKITLFELHYYSNNNLCIIYFYKF